MSDELPAPPPHDGQPRRARLVMDNDAAGLHREAGWAAIDGSPWVRFLQDGRDEWESLPVGLIITVVWEAS